VSPYRYTLRLHRGLFVRAEVEANIDPADNAALRAQFEAMVKAKTGTLNTDLTKWTLRVHRLGGGMVIATVTVARSGATVVTR